MRALVCRGFGPPEQLELGELPLPNVGDNDVLIQVFAAGVSFADTLMIRDLHQNKHQLPFAPGMEVAGTVYACGRDVVGLQVGQRVMGLVYDGGYAEFALARDDDVYQVPDLVGFELAAAMSSVYLTAHAALRWEACLRPGERVLVLGAGGGAGLAAVAVSRALGAKVIAAASNTEKLQLARAHGADEVIDYGRESLKERASGISGDGVDIVFDPVGGALHEIAIGCLKGGGRYLIIGFAAGKIQSIAANRLLVKNRSAIGFVLMHYRRERNALLRQSWRELLDLVSNGALCPMMPRIMPLEAGPHALRALIDRNVAGKIVLTKAGTSSNS